MTDVLGAGRSIAIVAGDGNVRIIKGIASFNASFDAFCEDMTAGTEQMGSQQEGQFADDGVVVERAAGQVEDFAVAVFVADGADVFGGEVVFGGDVEGVGGEHGECDRG